MKEFRVCIDDYVSDSERFFNNHIYLFQYQGIIRKTLLNYKFYEKAYIYKFFEKILVKNTKSFAFLQIYDIIIPVPISKNRLKKRGYNQSELIARILSNITGLQLITDCLYKNTNNKVQSTLNKKERVINVQGVYNCKNDTIIQNKKILLVDDIYTTGSTANECSKVLKTVNAKEIGIFTIAKD